MNDSNTLGLATVGMFVFLMAMSLFVAENGQKKEDLRNQESSVVIKYGK